MAVTPAKTIPARSAAAVTPSDTTDLSRASRALYIGGAGDISVEMAGEGSAVVFKGIPAGTLIPIQVTRVNSTSTTATDIVAIY